MEKNQDHTEPECEGIRLQDKASIADNTNMCAATSIKKEKAKCISLFVVLSLLAISIVVAIELSACALVSSNQGMDSLMKEIQELKMQLKKTKETDIADLKKDLNYTLTRIKLMS